MSQKDIHMVTSLGRSQDAIFEPLKQMDFKCILTRWNVIKNL